MKYLSLAVALVFPAAAAAQIPEPGLDIRGEIVALSDYRFRGLSRSDGGPALQGRFTAVDLSGLYGGIRATTLDDAWNLGGSELDLYAGYGADIGDGFYLDAGVVYYLFPGGNGATDYVEPYASLSYQIGPLQATAGAKYAPAQTALGDEDLLYLYAEAQSGIPRTPLTLAAGVGRQEGKAFGGSYWNWRLGGQARKGRYSAGLFYVESDEEMVPDGDATLVLSLGISL